jgi:REP element-mobilizing transposase RayT
MPHRPRPALSHRYPVHVTLRVQPHVWNLRGRQCFRVIARAFAAAHRRGAFRLNEFSVQGNHLHLIVEANDAKALARGLQSLEIRIARGLNAEMGTRASVFTDRYHAHILRTPTEVANALGYVRGNFRPGRTDARVVLTRGPASTRTRVLGGVHRWCRVEAIAPTRPRRA